jgi:hypothetical protein
MVPKSTKSATAKQPWKHLGIASQTGPDCLTAAECNGEMNMHLRQAFMNDIALPNVREQLSDSTERYLAFREDTQLST